MRWEIDQQALPAISIEKGVNKRGYCTIKIEDLALITPMLGGWCRCTQKRHGYADSNPIHSGSTSFLVAYISGLPDG